LYDFIGDIHGHADALRALLKKLGYSEQAGVCRHPERKAVFVGDFIDRGPNSREALSIARNMVEADQALATMGNHEYNAICLYEQHENGEYYRRRTFKNIRQQARCLMNFRQDPELYADYRKWMRNLPLFLELPEGLRVAHASWNTEHIDFMKAECGSGVMSDEFLKASRIEGKKEREVIGSCLVGQELELPPGVSFNDSDGRARNDMRVKWWSDPHGKTFNEIGLSGEFPEEPVPDEIADTIYTYPETDPLFFFGHYWLQGIPHIQKKNVCCLDFSVAKGGVLTAYRWNGESELNNEHLLWV